MTGANVQQPSAAAAPAQDPMDRPYALVSYSIAAVLGLYAAGLYLWDYLDLKLGAVHSLKQIGAAFGIFMVFGLIGVQIPAVIRAAGRFNARFPIASILIIAWLATWLLVNGADYWHVMALSYIAAGVLLGLLSLVVPQIKKLMVPRASGGERAQRRFFVVIVVSWWLSYSALDWIWEGRSPLPLASTAQAASAQASRWRALNVGVALSGGGYRAALMHAGVLKALRDRGVPVTHLSTVSGGSIIGAFYAAGGDVETFRDAVGAGRMNLFRMLPTVQSVVRLPFPMLLPVADVALFRWYSFGRSDLQAELLDRVLFQQKTLENLSGPVRLQICATDLRTGRAIGISRDGTIVRAAPALVSVPETPGAFDYEADVRSGGNYRGERLATLVSASGAFPGAFNAVSLPKRAPASEPPLLLSDGGLLDNLGITLLLERHHLNPDAWGLDLVMVSDGGQSFDEEAAVERAGVFDELPRALDIVYNSAAWRGDRSRALPRMQFLRAADVRGDDDFRALWNTFDTTDTLSAAFGEERAGELFALGEQLVAKNWRQLEALLEGANRRSR